MQAKFNTVQLRSADGEGWMVLLGGGLDDHTRSAYRAQIRQNAPGLRIVDHVGGKDGFVRQVLALASAEP